MVLTNVPMFAHSDLPAGAKQLGLRLHLFQLVFREFISGVDVARRDVGNTRNLRIVFERAVKTIFPVTFPLSSVVVLGLL